MEVEQHLLHNRMFIVLDDPDQELGICLIGYSAKWKYLLLTVYMKENTLPRRNFISR